jgi:hypothetical protein
MSSYLLLRRLKERWRFTTATTPPPVPGHFSISGCGNALELQRVAAIDAAIRLRGVIIAGLIKPVEGSAQTSAIPAQKNVPWKVRGGSHHFTHSKVMGLVAFDGAAARTCLPPHFATPRPGLPPRRVKPRRVTFVKVPPVT